MFEMCKFRKMMKCFFEVDSPGNGLFLWHRKSTSREHAGLPEATLHHRHIYLYISMCVDIYRYI